LLNINNPKYHVTFSILDGSNYCNQMMEDNIAIGIFYLGYGCATYLSHRWFLFPCSVLIKSAVSLHLLSLLAPLVRERGWVRRVDVFDILRK
jgi:hypothetical protein